MRIIVLFLIIIVNIIPLFGFANPWKVSLDANLTLTQNAYSDNWVGGEAGAISWTFNSNSLAESQLSSIINNKNVLKLFYGQTHNQDLYTKAWIKPVKSTDLIDFESIFRFTFGKFADPYTAFRLESQFFDESDPEKSQFFDPVKFTESVGVAKVIIKEDKIEWIARIGGGLRQYINRDVIDPLTEKRETKMSYDGGVDFVIDFKSLLANDRITFTSKLSIFKALFYSEVEQIEDLSNKEYWKSPDINWENIFTAGITKYLMVNLYIQILYDKELDLSMRFKQTLALGLTYKFI